MPSASGILLSLGGKTGNIPAGQPAELATCRHDAAGSTWTGFELATNVPLRLAFAVREGSRLMDTNKKDDRLAELFDSPDQVYCFASMYDGNDRLSEDDVAYSTSV